MSTTRVCSVPSSEIIKDEATYLWVTDDNGTLVADYDFCTGLRLIGSSEDLTLYINDDDLAAGRWSLVLTTITPSGDTEVVTRTGVKEDGPASRTVPTGNPWDGCSPVKSVNAAERQRRLSSCLTCPLLDREFMVCSVSGKPVLSATTKDKEFCPTDIWGNKQDVLRALGQEAVSDGTFTPGEAVTFGADDQAAFEAELDTYLEGLG